ncbi:MAG: alpha/beta hydrolase, partial [Variovorax sp.]|nr:alpha/beta hydrolase [Variovorax sp.]
MTTATHEPIAPPSRLLLLAEARALWETGAGLAMWPLLQLAPRGDGHPVLVLPGLVASDVSTLLLRRYLCSRGYDAHGWGQGRNL